MHPTTMTSFAPNTYLLIALLLTVIVQGIPSDESDDDCKTKPCNPGFFCYKETDRCAPCIDCASRYRHSNGWCHQKASDCGECLPGYMEPPLEHDVPKESCMPTTSKTSSSQPGTEHVNYVIFLSAVTILCVVFMSAFLYRWHKVRGESPPQEATELQELMVTQHQHQQPPPPYSPFAYKPADAAVSPEPTAPVLESSTVQIDSPRNCETNIFVEARRWPQARERTQLVQAAVCNPPNWVNTSDYRPDTPPSPTPPASEDSGDGGFGDTIHDENTQESHWTPNTSQENVEESSNQGANHSPGACVGSTAVGTVDMPDVENCRECRRGRRASSGDLASSQESHDEAPRQKRMRSESPPQEARNFPLVNNNNSSSNNNNISHQGVNQFNLLQFNLNLNRSDDRREQPDQNPIVLVDSEDFS